MVAKQLRKDGGGWRGMGTRNTLEGGGRKRIREMGKRKKGGGE